MAVIGYQQMLRLMEEQLSDGRPVEFSLVFVRGTGKRAGSLKEVRRVSKLGHAAHDNHKERGTLPLYDVAKARPMTPVADNIIYFNNLKVLH